MGSRQQRTVLAILIADVGRAVGDDVLIEALWPASPPASAHNNLQALVSRLRKALGAHAIERRGDAYALVLGDDSLDVQLFAALAGKGRALLERGDAAGAEKALTEALRLFLGEPYADFRYDDFAAGEIARLEQLRLAALEDRLDALLLLGRDRDVVSEAEALVAAHPYHERFRYLLVLALYRLGRQADALAAHRDARRTLVDDLGVDPSREFRDLERRILQQDPWLHPSTRVSISPGRGRAWLAAAVAAAVLVLVLVGVGLALLRHGSSPPRVSSNSLVALDLGTGKVVSGWRLPFEPRALAASDTGLWVTAARTNAVARIDPASGSVAQTIGLPGAAAASVVADSEGAWVASATSRTTFELDRYVPGSDHAVRTARWESPALFSVGERIAALAEGGGALWAGNGESAVDELDPATGSRRAHIVPDDGCGRIAWGGGALWCVYTLSDSLTRIEGRAVSWTLPLAQSGRPLAKVGTSRRGDVDPSAVAYGFGSVWVAAYGIASVIRVDPTARAVLATIPVGAGPNALAVGGGAVWVANRIGRSVVRIDPKLNRVTGTAAIGFRAESLAVARGRLWVAVQGR